MNYRCQFRARIGDLLGASSRDLRFEFNVELPFVPVVGMEISKGGWAAIPTTIWYEMDEERFVCATATIRIDPRMPEKREEAKEQLLGEGWQLSESS